MRERGLSKMWIVPIIIFVVFNDKLSHAQKISHTTFSCLDRPAGYYADVSTGCQIYHMCDGLGRQFSYTCPNATLFQQRMLICDHWYMVNCSRASQDYDANLLIGQRDKPFVEDFETARTPRPDLLIAPSNFTEYNIIYRNAQQQFSPRDVVGVENEDSSVTDQPTYFPPSSWSTEISRPPPTAHPENYQNGQRRPGVRGKAIDISASNKNRNNLVVNYKSTFKATTPVYPKSVEDTTESLDYIGLLPPARGANKKVDTLNNNVRPLELLPPAVINQGFLSRQDDTTNLKINSFSNSKPAIDQYQDELSKDIQEQLQQPEENDIKVNFRSNFKATTPVYPNFVDATSVDPSNLGVLPPQGSIVNFHSGFRATTPQYPSIVEATSPQPSVVGLLPPKETGQLPLQDDKDDLIRIHFESRVKAQNFPTYVDQTNSNLGDIDLLPSKENNGNDQNVNFQSNFAATVPNYPVYVDQTSPDPGDVGILPPNNYKNQINIVNYESNFRATTPKYPNYVDATSPNPNEAGLLPPKESSKVVYKSKFKATTPKYPTYVEATSSNPYDVGLVPPEETLVNFHSDFKATTPDYPTYVQPTSPNPGEAGLLAPQPDNLGGIINYSKNSGTREFVNSFSVPSKFNQPLDTDVDYSINEEELQEIPGIKLLNFMKSFNNAQWQELRQTFRIPEYDFPLDDATRPSYDSIVNSFEPVAGKK